MAPGPARRILLVHANSEWYGSDRSFVLLARGLHQRGWDVTAVVPAGGPVSDRLRTAGVRVEHADPGVPRPRVWGPGRTVGWAFRHLPLSCWRMWRLSRSADVVHLNTSTVLGALIGAALARRPIVIHVREHWTADVAWGRWYARLAEAVGAVAVAISTDIAEQARSAGFRRVLLVHNGLEFSAPMPAHRTGLLSVGRINEWKGQDVLLEAVGRLRRRGVDVSLQIAGDAYPGEEHLVERLRRRITELGLEDTVELLGFVEDVPSLYERSSIFVAPTTRPEPFGLALVDAMAAGLAAVASDAGGPRDIIRHGSTGLLVPMGDEAAVADAIELLWAEPDRAGAMGVAAAADVRQRFDIGRTVDRVEALYRDLLGAS